MGYIIHSAKGTTWSNHKYVKKVGNKYYYEDKNGKLVTEEELKEQEAAENEKTEADSKDSSTKSKSGSGSKKNTEKERISKLADQVMTGKLSQNQLRANGSKDYIDVMNAVNAKFKKPSLKSGSSKKKSDESDSKKSKSSENKESSKSKTEETKSVEEDTIDTSKPGTPSPENEVKEDTSKPGTPKPEETEPESHEDVKSFSNNVKDAIKKSTSINGNDSVYATKNADGTITVNVEFSDGMTQTFTLNQTFDVIDKTEKSKKQLTHSIFKGKGYLIHRMM